MDKRVVHLMSKKILVTLFVMFVFVSTAARVNAMSFEVALSAAYENNPSLKAQQANLRARDELVPQALVSWRPTVTLSGEYGRNYKYIDTLATRSDRRQYRNPARLQVQLAQNIYRGGRGINSVREACHLILSERANLVITEQKVLFSSAIAYLNVVRDEVTLRLQRSDEKVLERHLVAAKDRFDVGEITRTDVSQAEARLAGARADRIRAESNLGASYANFVNLIGQVPELVTWPPNIFTIPQTRQMAIEIAKSNNPKILAAFYAEKAAINKISLVRGEFAPTLALQGTARRDLNSTGKDTRIDTYEVLLTASMPLYEAGRTHSRLRETKQLASKARLSLMQAHRDVIESAEAAWDKLISTRARLESLETQISAAEIALDGVKREAEVGSRTVLDVLDAEQELLNAKIALVQTRRDELIDIFTLKVALGQMTAKNLDLDVQFYNPIDHYKEVRNLWIGTSSSEDYDEWMENREAAQEKKEE